MEKPPAFQLYARDIYTGCSDMSGDEFGAYVRAMCWSWDNGPLPLDLSRVARLMLVERADFDRIWAIVGPNWLETPAGFVNVRLETQREELEEYRRNCSKAGVKSGESRRNKRTDVQTPVHTDVPTDVRTEHGTSFEQEGQRNTNTPISDLRSPVFDLQTATPHSEVPRIERAEALVEAWNALTAKPIPACLELGATRRRHAKARLTERTLEQWRDVIARIGRSDFCRGQNDRGWVATFDWLLKAETAAKVLEGKYDNRPTPLSAKGKPMLDAPEIRRQAQSLGSYVESWQAECVQLHDATCGGPNAHRARMMREIGDFVGGEKSVAS